MASEILSKAQNLIFNSPLYTNLNARLAFTTIGSLYLLCKTLTVSKCIFGPLLTFGHDLAARYGKHSWVVVTGASDGIGKEFCLEFARHGFNIVLIARNREKTEQVAREINEKYPMVGTRVVVADFTDCWQEDFMDKLYSEVIDLDISIVVNNVGINPGGEYKDMPLEDIRNSVLVNCLSQALVTRVFLPKLVERSHRSAIISLSSMAAVCPRPYFQIYSACKVFNDYLSRSLDLEYPNIDTLSLKPAFVSTNMTGNKEEDMLTITTEKFVRTGLSYLGNKASTHGHWKHRLDAFKIHMRCESANVRAFKKRWETIKELKAKNKK